MFKIGEFSILSSISIPMLRHYDKLGLMKPDHVDGFTGYRYYGPEQLATANRIIALKRMGFGLKEIKALNLAQLTDEGFRSIMRQKQKEKQQEYEELKKQLDCIQETIDSAAPREYKLSVAVKEIPERKMACMRGVIHAFPEEGTLWQAFFGACSKNGIEFPESGVNMSIQHAADFEKSEFDVEVLKSVEKMGKDTDTLKFRTLPACTAASLVFKGSYQQFTDINLYFAEWLQKNSYKVCGRRFVLYHVSPGESADEEKFVTELCFPIQKA